MYYEFVADAALCCDVQAKYTFAVNEFVNESVRIRSHQGKQKFSLIFISFLPFVNEV